MRQEIADLERRFLERVAQTNRAQNTGGGAAAVTVKGASYSLNYS